MVKDTPFRLSEFIGGKEFTKIGDFFEKDLLEIDIRGYLQILREKKGTYKKERENKRNYYLEKNDQKKKLWKNLKKR